VSESSKKRSEEFLKICGQFKLGVLVTESSHPVTANLSEVAKQDTAAALKLLFDVDNDVMKKFREFVESGRSGEIKKTILHSLKSGGRIFFTGCGSTGRLSILLDSVWRDFWQQQSKRQGDQCHTGKKPDVPHVVAHDHKVKDFENRTFSVMAGGDYALIKSVEGFEDFTLFGKKQINDLGVSAKDVVFAITEGGETSFVIGTAWAGVDAGAKVYFVYNNPDDILCEHVERSREVIADARIEKINLTTGPMAIAGSTRMQATSIQLCVMLTILEMVVRDLVMADGHHSSPGPADSVPAQFLAKLAEMHISLKSPELLAQLAKLVMLEEAVYRSGHKINYFAHRLGIDVLTDTTERSPTYCTPPFRKFDDATATESWAFLFLPQTETADAWHGLLKRGPRCVEWTEEEIRALVGEEKFVRTLETIRKISRAELMRFKIGLDGIPFRPFGKHNVSTAIIMELETDSWLEFQLARLESERKRENQTSVIYFGKTLSKLVTKLPKASGIADAATLVVPVPDSDFLLDGVTRVAVKLVMNTLSTCTMVRLGRVMGNYMVWVVPSNLKLIDRATRYITRLTDLDYEAANVLLFDIIEYVEPRMKLDQAYPPVVGMAVLRAKFNLTNEAAERRLLAG
jgi:N-acetylmuramic acid 6-phosphate etherase